ncbi:membrane protein [Lampropedia cohaerens]|uniref:Membrane protein n=1 Tax=Lampropedia cohaerens TaxID=1610491 RepID=A0A0U1Q188_9BURK|nr:membrane protein [Lampropedia cohaerens]KKW68534.1 membrane protein [Lampropedia cohaerens]
MQDAQDNEVIEVQARAAGKGPDDDALRTIGWISYIMHLVVAIGAVVPMLEPSMVLLLLALVLDLVKRSDAQGTWQQSHFDWRIRSVAWALVLYVVTSPFYLLLYFPGKVAWFFVSVWFLVRIVRGMMALNQRQPVR